MIDTVSTNKFLDALDKVKGETLDRGAIAQVAEDLGLPFPRWYANVTNFRVGRGQYRKPTAAEVVKWGLGYNEPGTRGRKPAIAKAPKAAPVAAMALTVVETAPADPTVIAAAAEKIEASLGTGLLLAPEYVPTVPVAMKGYVEWGWFRDLVTLFQSKTFMPVMITGPSGNGKTEMVEQAAAEAQRDFVRLNITNQTDEDDLLGGFRLVNGETKFALGPVPLAMITGSICLLDEKDLGGAALMCLQPVLEGKPLFLKKISKWITPAPGFNVVATANTKGRGDDGKYAHTTIMNEAMLERYSFLFEQVWPEAADERKILAYQLKAAGKYDADLVKHLVEFANLTRARFAEQACSSEIATRRLLHIIKGYITFGDINKVMKMALSRFDADVAAEFLKLWEAIHPTEAAVASPSGSAIPVSDPVPF